MPIQIVDGFGQWDDLGVLQPRFEEWLTFPDYSLSFNPLIRLRYFAEEFDKNSYGFIRCRYESNNAIALGKWVRFYPKFEDDFLTYPHNYNIFDAKDEVRLVFQVMKRHKKRRRVGTLNASLWQVNLNIKNEDIIDDQQSSNPTQSLPDGYFINLL